MQRYIFYFILPNNYGYNLVDIFGKKVRGLDFGFFHLVDTELIYFIEKV